MPAPGDYLTVDAGHDPGRDPRQPILALRDEVGKVVVGQRDMAAASSAW